MKRELKREHRQVTHLHQQGDEELARFVAVEGEKHLSGSECLKFRSLVHGLFPDIGAGEEAARKKRLQEHRERNFSALGAALKEKVAAKKARGKGPAPSRGEGWNLPLAVRNQ